MRGKAVQQIDIKTKKVMHTYGSVREASEKQNLVDNK